MGRGGRGRGPIRIISGPTIISFSGAAAIFCVKNTRRVSCQNTMNSQSLSLFVAGSILPTFVVALLATYLVRKIAARWGLIDLPSERKVHTTPTPRGGGLAVWFAVVATFAVAQAVLWYV